MSRGSVARPFVAVMDQVVVSLAHFVLGLSVARSGDPLSLGLFGLAVIITGTIGDLHRAAIWLPMTHKTDASQYSAARRLSALMAAGICLVGALVVSVFVASGEVRYAGLASVVTVSVPLLLIYEIQRRIQFADLRVGRALAVDCAYAATAIGTVLLLPQLPDAPANSVLRALIAWAIAAAVGAAGGAILLSGRLPASRLRASDLMRTYWPTSRAYLLNSVLVFGAQRASMLVIALILGTAALGNVEAARLLTAPLMVAALGAASVIIPIITHSARNTSLEDAVRMADRIALASVAAACLYGGLMVAGVDWISQLVFGTVYEGSDVLAVLYSGVAGTSAYATAMLAPLGVMDRTAAVPRSRFPGVLLVMGLVYPAAVFFGVAGVMALVLMEGALTAILLRRAVGLLGPQ